MKIALYEEGVVTRDIPEENLDHGDVATLIDYVPHPAGTETGAVLEIFNAIGQSIGVAIVPLSATSPLQANQRWTIRPLSLAMTNL